MTVGALGIVAFLIGVVGVYRGHPVDLVAFAVSLLFGAAAGLIFDNLGGVNLLVAHIMLGFLALGALLRRQEFAQGLNALAPGRAGYWLLLVVAYGVISAAFLPRLFAGAVIVYSVSRGGGDPTLGPVTSPLGPVSGNISQTFYVVSDLVCFFVCSAACASEVGFKALCRATIACAALNLLFGVLDYVTFAAGAADMLAFMRNATYRMLDDTEVLGYKRIVGSFSEASSFATATLSFFAFTARLALAGRSLKFTAPLAFLSFVALLASTSTTAYVGGAVVLLFLYLTAVRTFVARSGSWAGFAFLCAGPPLAAAVLLAAVLNAPLWDAILQFYDQTIAAKASSSSGLERSAWNNLALASIPATAYLGAGVGSVRASSFLVAVPASIGVPGAALYALFLYHVLLKPIEAQGDGWRADMRRAARFACFAQFVAGSLAGVFIDLGLQFFLFASLSTASPLAARSAARPRSDGAFAGARPQPI